MTRHSFLVTLRTWLGVPCAVLGCVFSCSALGQAGSEQATNALAEGDAYPLRLSKKLGASRREIDETPVSRAPLSDPAGQTRIDTRRTGSWLPEAVLEADVDSAETRATRRIPLPPGELNTSGVVRAGRMSIQDGVPVLQRQGETASSRERPAEGESLKD